MALPAINLGGSNLPPEILGQQQALNRQQQMAQLLMQQGQQTPQGQMISGRYVAPSFTQNLASLANAYVGGELAKKGDKQALELASQLRQRYGDELKEFRNLMQGRENQAPNVQGAYDFAASAYNPALQAVGIKKLTPEEFTLNEGAKRFITMPDGTSREIAAGGQKPRAPLQIDTGTAIELRDPNNPTIVLQRIPKSLSPADTARMQFEGMIGGGMGLSTTIPHAHVVDILDPFSTTKNTTTRTLSGRATGGVALDSFVYLSTSAITSVQVMTNAANYLTASRFSLYGIKG